MSTDAVKALSVDGQLTREFKRVNADEGEECCVRVVLLSSAEELERYERNRLDASLRSFPALHAALLHEELQLRGRRVDVLFDPRRIEFGCDAFHAAAPQRSAGLAEVDLHGHASAFFAEGGYEALPALAQFAEALRAPPDLPALPLLLAEGAQRLQLLCSPELDDARPRRAQLAQRLQLLAALCVDSGVVADMHCNGWWVGLFLVEQQLAGFFTLFTFPTRRETHRLRVSQLLVFDDFRRRGLCRLALQAVYDKFLADERCERVTVEAPTLYFQAQRFRFLLGRFAADEALMGAARACREADYADTSPLLAAMEAAAKAGREAAEKLLHLLLYFEARQAGGERQFAEFYLARIKQLKAERATHAKTAFKRKFISFDGQPVSRMEIKRVLCAFEEQGSSASDVLNDELDRFAETCRPLARASLPQPIACEPSSNRC